MACEAVRTSVEFFPCMGLHAVDNFVETTELF